MACLVERSSLTSNKTDEDTSLRQWKKVHLMKMPCQHKPNSRLKLRKETKFKSDEKFFNKKVLI